MSEHTPGPWIAVGAWVEHPDDSVADICSCDPETIGQGKLGRGYAEICANARLIAAAPAMRAEIERQAKEIERLKAVPMKYRRMAFNAQLQEENAQLSEKIKQLTALMKKGGSE